MNTETYAAWLRGQGRRVVQSAGSYWHSAPMRTLQAFPYHQLLEPAEEELGALLRSQRVVGLRYSSAASAPVGCPSYHVVYEASSYDLDRLGKRTRHNVRLGLRDSSIEPIAFSLLANDGWRLSLDTLHRQGRSLRRTERAWRRMWDLAAELPGFEAWGAFHKGQLAATHVWFRMNDTHCLVHAQSLRQFHRYEVNKALAFTTIKAMVDRGDGPLFFGVESLDAPPSVDQFKFLMGAAAKPVRQRVLFRSALRPFLGRSAHVLLRLARRLRPQSSAFAKADGLMRFYLEAAEWPGPHAAAGPIENAS